MNPVRYVLLAACLSGAACASDPIDDHPANAEIQRQIAEIVESVRVGGGTTLFADLRRLVAYDVFAVDQMVELAEDDNARLRSNAIYVLSQIVDKEHPRRMARIEKTLRRGLDDADATVRYEAATGLAARGQWDVLPLLIDGLEHADSGVRYRCHQQLLETTSRDFGYSIDADAAVRAAAIARWRTWYEGWEDARG